MKKNIKRQKISVKFAEQMQDNSGELQNQANTRAHKSLKKKKHYKI